MMELGTPFAFENQVFNFIQDTSLEILKFYISSLSFRGGGTTILNFVSYFEIL